MAIANRCGETDTSEYLNGVLDDTEFRVVLNGNPHSRRKVEGGDFCLRVAESGRRPSGAACANPAIRAQLLAGSIQTPGGLRTA